MSRRMGSAGSRRLTDITMRFTTRTEASPHETTKPPLPPLEVDRREQAYVPSYGQRREPSPYGHHNEVHNSYISFPTRNHETTTRCRWIAGSKLLFRRMGVGSHPLLPDSAMPDSAMRCMFTRRAPIKLTGSTANATGSETDSMHLNGLSVSVFAPSASETDTTHKIGLIASEINSRSACWW